MAKTTAPVWDFEAFRSFLPYEVMQPAANVLTLFAGRRLDDRRAMQELSEALELRTGLAWTPDRSTGPLDFTDEGSLFRNKARLLASLFICPSPEMQRQAGETPVVRLLSFGKALSLGRVTRMQYYEFIIRQYRYPHPAFDSYEVWVRLGMTCRPFLMMLETLLELYRVDPAHAWIDRSELVNRIMVSSRRLEVPDLSRTLIKARTSAEEIADAGYPDIASRKAGDMMAFLAMSGYGMLEMSGRLFLNVVGRHPVERTYYLAERNAQTVSVSKVAQVELLINQVEVN